MEMLTTCKAIYQTLEVIVKCGYHFYLVYLKKQVQSCNISAVVAVTKGHLYKQRIERVSVFTEIWEGQT